MRDGESLSKHHFCVTLNFSIIEICLVIGGFYEGSPSDPLPFCQRVISSFPFSPCPLHISNEPNPQYSFRGPRASLLSHFDLPRNEIQKFSSFPSRQGVSTDSLLPTLFRVAEAHGGVKLAFHLEPYHGRSAKSVRADVQYLMERFGTSPALLRWKGRPVYYV